MGQSDLLQYLAFLAVVTAATPPLGSYIARVFAHERTVLDPLAAPLEQALLRLLGPAAAQAMTWQEYFLAFACFGLLGAALVFGLLELQASLPGHALIGAQYLSTPMTHDLALNTAVSFATTTTWQAYSGETTLSYFSQLVALGTQNFLAGAAGLAVGIALIRGIATDGGGRLGNFWRDVLRAVLWVLLPLAIPGALLLAWQGVPMNLGPYRVVATLEGAWQTIAQGPVAAFEIIKNLGTNGGGFFNANGAHPYENPNALSNLLELLSIVLLPAALCHSLGAMTGNRRHGWFLYGVMTLIFALGILAVDRAESARDPPVERALAASGSQLDEAGPRGNTEGRELRFGIAGTTLAVAVTSNGATGSAVAMDDSLAPLGGGVALLDMLLGELAYGGLGTGIMSMVLCALVTSFVGGLMTGRAPAYLGNSIGIREMKLIAAYLVIAPAVILPLTALALMTAAGRAGLATNGGPHGLTSIAFAYASSFANNGQAFAGLAANSPFYNYSTLVAMLAGRFLLTLPMLAVAGAFAGQRRRGITPGSLPTESGAFGVLLVAVILVVAGLCYLPLFCLGPIVEQLMLGR